MNWIQLLMVAALVVVHLFAGKLRFLDGIPRSRWLSMAGGISVAYVFLHVFPELEAAQAQIEEAWQVVPWVENHAYLVALFGLAGFYGLERFVKAQQQKQSEAQGDNEGQNTTGIGPFWLHIASFAIYNALIGYLLVHREEQDLRGLLFFSVAMALHFIVNDFGLEQDHRETYTQMGRWVLAVAILVGWGTGRLTKISESAIGLLFAFLAGGVVLNVLKEELPEERQSRFLPFVLGAGVYAALLLLL